MISIEKLDYIASHSKDIRKVGCILEPLEEFQKTYEGFNQAPNNLPMRDENNNTYDYVIHAEVSALLKADLTKKYNLYVSYAPCIRCASLIVYLGCVEKVYYKDILHNHKGGIKFLENAGIPCIKLKQQ